MISWSGLWTKNDNILRLLSSSISIFSPITKKIFFIWKIQFSEIRNEASSYVQTTSFNAKENDFFFETKIPVSKKICKAPFEMVLFESKRHRAVLHHPSNSKPLFRLLPKTFLKKKRMPLFKKICKAPAKSKGSFLITASPPRLPPLLSIARNFFFFFIKSKHSIVMET